MGCYCVLDCDGYERENIVDANIIFIAEGYATAASLFYWLGVPTVIAFSASNLTATSIALRDKYPTKRIIVCGDTGSDGVKYGEQAARMGNAELKTCPPLQHGSDYNDAYFQLHPDKIRAHILGGDYA